MGTPPPRPDVPAGVEQRLREAAPQVADLVSRARATLARTTRGLSERLVELGERHRTLINRADQVRRGCPEGRAPAAAAFDAAWREFERCRHAVEAGIARLTPARENGSTDRGSRPDADPGA